MRLVIIQPHFLPFIGYFDLMSRADIFVYYDTAQFVRRSWHCRTYIKEKGVARWFSIPVRTAGGSRKQLKDILCADDHPWRAKFIRRLEHCYASTREPRLLKEVLELIAAGPSGLCEWNIAANQLLAENLGVKTEVLRASHLPKITGERQQRIIRLCQELGATHYICGPGSKFYIRDEDFARFNIEVEWLKYDYEHCLRTERGEEVFPSVVDLIMSQGIRATADCLRASRAEAEHNDFTVRN